MSEEIWCLIKPFCERHVCTTEVIRYFSKQIQKSLNVLLVPVDFIMDSKSIFIADSESGVENICFHAYFRDSPESEKKLPFSIFYDIKFFGPRAQNARNDDR